MSSDNFILYLEENPKLFAVAKSELCIDILNFLKDKGLPTIEIKKNANFGKYSEHDLNTILNLLVNLKLLDVENSIHKQIYLGNANTLKFLSLYDKTKKNFSI